MVLLGERLAGDLLRRHHREVGDLLAELLERTARLVLDVAACGREQLLALLRRLRIRSGLPHSDHVVLIRNSRIVAGPGYLQGPIAATPGRTTTISIAGERYRALFADARLLP